MTTKSQPSNGTTLGESPQVVLPTLKLQNYDGLLCVICLRAVEPDRKPWSHFACANCRAIDDKVAGVFGARLERTLGMA